MLYICNEEFLDLSKDAIRKINHICHNCLNKMEANSSGNFIIKCNHLENHQNDKLKGYYLAKSPNSKNMCPICFSKKMKCSNPNCNNIIDHIYIKDDNIHFCSQKCQRIVNSLNRVEKNSREGNCFKCGKFVKHRDVLGFGVECGCCKNNANKATQASIPIVKELWRNNEEFRNKCQSHGVVKYKYCNKCNQNTLHNGRFCTKCNPESQPGSIPNFIIKNNVKFYKGETVENVIKKLDSGKYSKEDFPGFEKRYDRWTYHGKDLLTNEFYSLIGLFHEFNGFRYYKQYEIHEFCEKILSGELDKNNFSGINVRYGRICYYTKDILTDSILSLNSNFYEFNGKRYYKSYEINDFCEKNLIW